MRTRKASTNHRTFPAAALALIGALSLAPPAGAAEVGAEGQVLVAMDDSPLVFSADRLWQISRAPSTGREAPDLVSWPLRRSGRMTAVPLELTAADGIPPAGSPSGQPSLGDPIGGFAIDGPRAYLEVDTCNADGCLRAPRLPYVFSTTTGALLAKPRSDQRPTRILDLRPGVLALETTADPSGLTSDASVNGAPLNRTVPTTAAVNNSFAGRFRVDPLEAGTDSGTRSGVRAYTVSDYRTGVVRYRVTREAILTRAGVPDADIASVRVQPDGSLAIEVGPRITLSGILEDRSVRDGMFPVYVDRDGVVRRAGPRLTTARTTQAVPAQSRIYVASAGLVTGTGTKRRAQCKGAWLTNVDGSRGFNLAAQRGIGALRAAGPATYWDGTTAVVKRLIDGQENRGRYIVRQLGRVPLTSRGRPACSQASTSYRLHRDQPFVGP